MGAGLGRARRQIDGTGGRDGDDFKKLSTGIGEAGLQFSRGGTRGASKIDAPHISFINNSSKSNIKIRKNMEYFMKLKINKYFVGQLDRKIF
jgi:hypothetical protein